MYKPKVIVRDSDVHGLGVFAKQDIEEGEIILTERSHVFHYMKSHEIRIKASDACFLVKKLIEKKAMMKQFKQLKLNCDEKHSVSMPDADNRFLRRLSYENKLPFEELRDIWKVVCQYYMRITFPPQTFRIQLSPFCNRLNHSNNYNAAVGHACRSYTAFLNNIVVVAAMRPIEAGEEVTIWYLPEHRAYYADLSAINHDLKRLYGFESQSL
ncbi:SET domain-containing protein-lysine N-methyltransferase [Planctobacterium marinum]|uniref:SET domain-containing protein-lysine N-methyltransferase n=1 Tax=Planctobacterium marinum TaxID=1631968 RepID=UPI001E3BFB05|nr:SET domain-containing protein-lysine N-methyltransferase [Planctobacterium marinum]MCC2607928.1 SET domain-containing protein-lysine N-methyltransferase [Planctobacterium marinum]